MIDPKFFNFVSQMAHLLLGSTIVLASVLFVPKDLYLIWVIFTLATAWKEFYYDYHWEDAATRGSSLLDFACYNAGAALTYLVSHLAGKI